MVVSPNHVKDGEKEGAGGLRKSRMAAEKDPKKGHDSWSTRGKSVEIYNVSSSAEEKERGQAKAATADRPK